MTLIAALLVSKPEQEQNLLRLLVNKLVRTLSQIYSITSILFHNRETQTNPLHLVHHITFYNSFKHIRR